MDDKWYDRDIEERVYGLKACGLCFIAMVAILVLLLLFSGCSQRVVTVPEIHTEYVYKTDSFVKRDSILVKDSVFVREKGDTVWIERFKTLYKEIFKEKIKSDTVIKRDSIPYKVEVEKPLTWWQRQKIEFGGIFMLILSGLLVFKVINHKFL